MLAAQCQSMSPISGLLRFFKPEALRTTHQVGIPEEVLGALPRVHKMLAVVVGVPTGGSRGQATPTPTSETTPAPAARTPLAPSAHACNSGKRLVSLTFNAWDCFANRMVITPGE